MRFLIATTILCFVALTQGQRYPKVSVGQKQGGGGASQSHNGPSQHNQYTPSPYQGGGGGVGGSYNGLGGAGGAKPVHAQLISDSRTLNNDGTINFQYAADNGLQQGETVDPDGTRRGFYSYPGADGKLLTVKYTAGKNGFVAEGDHLPRQPSAAAHSDTDEARRPGSHSGAYQGGPAQGQYHGGNQGHGGRAPSYSSSGHGHRAGPQGVGSSDNGQYHHPSPAPQYNHGARPQAHYSPSHGQQGGHQGQGPSPGFFGGQGQGFQDFGPVNYGAPSHAAHAAPQTQYNSHALPSLGAHTAPARHNGNGAVHSAFNPYQQAGPAGPYAGQFDLGNGGQFSINFNPGKSQEVQPGGDYGGHLQQQRY